MKRVWRWAAKVLLVAAMVLSLPAGALPARAAGSLPTEFDECSIQGGFWDPYTLSIGFETSDSTSKEWLDAIKDEITVNDTTYTKKSSLSTSDSGNYWCIGTFAGQQGRVNAIQILGKDFTYPTTIHISADGYPNSVITVEKKTQGYSEWLEATIAEESTPTPTPDPDPTEYMVTVSDDIENGRIAIDKTTAQQDDTVTITATPDEGYDLKEITVKDADGNAITITDGKFTMPASNVTVSATFEQKDTPKTDPDPSGLKEIALDQVSVSESSWRDTWYFTISGDGDYVGKITSLAVNDTAWEKSSFLYTGGKYKLNESENRVELAEQSYGSPEAIKSGDVVTITADGYKPLTFKFINVNGKVSLEPNDGQGDHYELRVKLEGSFDSAITGQEYDAISGASTGVSLSKNSSVTVYGALVEKGSEPGDDDWQELDAWTSGSSGINLDSSKCHAYVVADTDKGTAESKDSGLSGVYLVISSDLTLSGTAKDPGDYLVYVEITDEQGRTATSNKIPVCVYSGDEALADQMIIGNMTQTQDGKYMWDMEPWAIKNFGSNVSGETESVRVLPGLKAWYGSHTSGTYGYLGYDLAWSKVMAGEIPQTLYIPKGCDLTLVNMEILSSVRIVIEDGGRLTLRDSVVQGIIDVEKGGTFSMNYDSYSGKFLTGASVCGQIRLQDGAILENAAIYSHANYLANGDLTDRTAAHPVVTATGNVTIKGDVYIEGDAGGSVDGQTGLLIKDGTVTIGKDSTLVVIGGESMLGWDGGTAIKLDHGEIAGEGKLVALGGESGPVQGDGGAAVSGNGTISTDQTFLRGATAYEGIAPGKAIASGSSIRINSQSKSIEDGVYKDLYGDPYGELYWRTGIDPQPPLDKYTLDPVTRYTVKVMETENGKVTPSKTEAEEGDEVTLTAAPDDGYELASLQVVDAEGREILSWVKDSRAVRTDRFLMPASNVTVSAVFTEQAASDDNKTNPGDDSSNPGDKTDPGDNSSNPGDKTNPGDNSSNSGDKTNPGDDTNSGSEINAADHSNANKGSGSSDSHRHSSSSSAVKSSSSGAVSANVNGSSNTGMNGGASAVAIAESGAANDASNGSANVAGAVGAEGTDATAIITEQGAAGTENDHIITTGDDAHMALWLSIMIMSAAALVAVIGYNRRNVHSR